MSISVVDYLHAFAAAFVIDHFVIIGLSHGSLSVLHTSLENSHILWSFDPMSYLGANYLMVQLTVEQADMGTNVCFWDYLYR